MSTSTWSHTQHTVQSILKKFRSDAGLTQLQLAERLGKPQSYVSKYESGERRLDVIEVREVVNAMDSSLIKFVNMLELELAKKEHIS
ncbi:MAG: helix-turn-helix transcriptional regulator [Burkholderiales bacterium]|nr:helix-turn-helix transcriptional regulator [Burkholderiales bacterium]